MRRSLYLGMRSYFPYTREIYSKNISKIYDMNQLFNTYTSTKDPILLYNIVKKLGV